MWHLTVKFQDVDHANRFVDRLTRNRTWERDEVKKPKPNIVKVSSEVIDSFDDIMHYLVMQSLPSKITLEVK